MGRSWSTNGPVTRLVDVCGEKKNPVSLKVLIHSIAPCSGQRMDHDKDPSLTQNDNSVPVVKLLRRCCVVHTEKFSRMSFLELPNFY